MKKSQPLLVSGWLSLPPEALLRACKQARYQGSGPGGQKRNRVYSGIRLVHPESGIAIESEASRESRRNLEDALHRLRLALALSIVPMVCLVPANPVQNREDDFSQQVVSSPAFLEPAFRANISPNHMDYPILALRALYYFDKHQGQTAMAAQALGCTASALTRFFKGDKGLWVRAKVVRETNGLHPLK